MFISSLFLVLCAIINILIYNTLAAPFPFPATNSNETQFIHPHIITIERLESLLRRASEIFRPTAPEVGVNNQQQYLPIPYQELQPPTAHPYNFYLPPFEHENEDASANAKLDEKSRNMEKFRPPPLNNGNGVETNFYAAKPKKQPKKFNASEKLVNIRWLNAFEREALADANGELPKAVYLNNEEQNRINFDDSFFAVDMHVRTPKDNNPHKDTSNPNSPNNSEGENDFTSASEGDEDLVAAPAAHLTQITRQVFKAPKVV